VDRFSALLDIQLGNDSHKIIDVPHYALGNDSHKIIDVPHYAQNPGQGKTA